MKNPKFVEFTGDSLKTLQGLLVAAAPEENCALLIGEHQTVQSQNSHNPLQIKKVWPCRNVWESLNLNPRERSKSLFALYKQESWEKASRKNRFLIDPQEQILAQKWARRKNWFVMGSAHSHPMGAAEPSHIDRHLNFSPGLMVISDKFGQLRAWWMYGNKHKKPTEVSICNKQTEGKEALILQKTIQGND